MKKYKLVGVTEYAERHLSVDDLDAIKAMIGCEIEESDNKAQIDDGRLFITPDGVETHIDFLQIEESNHVLYSGLAWKHHISEHFENSDRPPHPNGAGKGSTIFTDYNKMIEYLKNDGRCWHVAELKLQNESLIFEFGNNYMATIQKDCLSEQGFKPLA